MLSASYFDGVSTRVREVSLALVDNDLVITGESVDLHVPFTDVVIDERLGRAARRLRLPDGAFCEVRDLDQLDSLLLSAGHRDGWVDRMQRRLRVVLVALVAFVLVVAAAYKWGLPVAGTAGKSVEYRVTSVPWAALQGAQRTAWDLSQRSHLEVDVGGRRNSGRDKGLRWRREIFLVW